MKRKWKAKIEKKNPRIKHKKPVTKSIRKMKFSIWYKKYGGTKANEACKWPNVIRTLNLSTSSIWFWYRAFSSHLVVFIGNEPEKWSTDFRQWFICKTIGSMFVNRFVYFDWHRQMFIEPSVFSVWTLDKKKQKPFDLWPFSFSRWNFTKKCLLFRLEHAYRNNEDSIDWEIEQTKINSFGRNGREGSYAITKEEEKVFFLVWKKLRISDDSIQLKKRRLFRLWNASIFWLWMFHKQQIFLRIWNEIGRIAEFVLPFIWRSIFFYLLFFFLWNFSNKKRNRQIFDDRKSQRKTHTHTHTRSRNIQNSYHQRREKFSHWSISFPMRFLFWFSFWWTRKWKSNSNRIEHAANAHILLLFIIYLLDKT